MYISLLDDLIDRAMALSTRLNGDGVFRDETHLQDEVARLTILDPGRRFVDSQKLAKIEIFRTEQKNELERRLKEL